MTSLNSSRVFACHAGSSWFGRVRGSGAATAEVAEKASRTPSSLRIQISRIRRRTLSPKRGSSSGDAVPFRKIFRAAHFLETADRSLELEAAVAGRIKSLGFGVGCREQFHLVLVERVDQRDEPRRFVAHVGA